MKFRIKQIVIVCAALAFASVHGSSSQRMGNYDFSYESSGAEKVRPIQVFDDGHATFFQFRAGEPIPAIFVNGPSGPVMQVPEMQGPYARVGLVSSKYILRIGYGTGEVVYAGDRLAQSGNPGSDRPGAKAADSEALATQPSVAVEVPSMRRLEASVGGNPTLTKNVFNDQPSPRIALDLNSYATPIKGDLAQFPKASESAPMAATAAVQPDEAEIPFVPGVFRLGPIGTKLTKSLANTFRAGVRFEITGRNDISVKDRLASKRANSVADMLVANGVPRHVITVKVTNKVLSTRETSAASGVEVVEYHSDASAMAIGRVEQPHTGFQEASINTWTLRATDGTVQGVLQRWADAAGWRLIWKNGPEVMITGDAELVRDGFVSASDYLLSQSRSFGHHIKGRAYNNKVLVVTSD